MKLVSASAGEVWSEQHVWQGSQDVVVGERLEIGTAARDCTDRPEPDVSA